MREPDPVEERDAWSGGPLRAAVVTKTCAKDPAPEWGD